MLEKDTFTIFLAEAEELIDVTFSDLKLLRDKKESGRDRRETVRRIFRHIHTIKGSAASIGLTDVSRLSHEIESVLDGIRTGRIDLTGDLIHILEDSVTLLSNLLKPGTSANTRALESTILGLKVFHTGSSTPDKEVSLPANLTSILNDADAFRVREALSEGARLLSVHARFDIETFDTEFRDLSAVLLKSGEIVTTIPSLDEENEREIAFQLIFLSNQSEDEIGRTVAAHKAEVRSLGAKSILEHSPTDTPAPDDMPGGQSSVSSLTTLVRVPLQEVDELVSATHNLMTDVTTAFEKIFNENLLRESSTDLELASARIKRRFSELEERLVELRMVPVEPTLQRVARSGQTVAKSVSKDVNINVTGGEVRLDKSLADEISDSLLHIIRNAVDHGIEGPSERVNVGKSGQGTIGIEALQEGSRVVIRVTDDGRGIDPESIYAKALKLDLVKPEQSLTTQEKLRFIFHPGFSTADEVSTLSGRGVGLDVVDKVVEKYGGELNVRSEPGVSTTFEMILPTTLSLIPSLVVRSSGSRFLIDAGHILEAGFASPEDLSTIEGVKFLNWRGDPIPFVMLRRLLGHDEESVPPNVRIPVVISKILREGLENLKTIAIGVDEWEGYRDVLIKGLGAHAQHWRGVGGATQMPDGTVAILLDLPRLIQMPLTRAASS